MTDYGEPWIQDGREIVRGGYCVPLDERQLARAVACVNALAGHDPREVEA